MTIQRIALFLPSLECGGAERVMVLLANVLSSKGYAVDLVLVRAVGPFLADVCSSVRVIDLGVHRTAFSLSPFITYIKRERPSAILSAITHSNILALIASLLSDLDVPVIVSEHSNPEAALRGGWRNRILTWMVSLLYPKAAKVICVSAAARDVLCEITRVPVEITKVVYNPLDISRIRMRMTDPVHHKWINNGSARVIVAVGRLVPAKDYPTLLLAFKILSYTQAVRLIIVGDGPEKNRLVEITRELKIEKVVDFVGFQSNPYAWMSACDIYVLSSKWEGLPTALIEALVCGAKVVSTDCMTGPREILEHGQWGVLTPVGDAPALAGAISHALDRPKPHLPQEVLERFAPDIVAEQYGEIISSAAAAQLYSRSA